jgi:hypothetical protein
MNNIKLHGVILMHQELIESDLFIESYLILFLPPFLFMEQVGRLQIVARLLVL